MERLHTTPYDGPPVDTEALRRDIREYVRNCREAGEVPDAFAFAITYGLRWGDVPGREIDRTITEENEKGRE